MPLLLSLLSILGLVVLGGVLVAQFWTKVTDILARDEESIYGESLRSACLER